MTVNLKGLTLTDTELDPLRQFLALDEWSGDDSRGTCPVNLSGLPCRVMATYGGLDYCGNACCQPFYTENENFFRH